MTTRTCTIGFALGLTLLLAGPGCGPGGTGSTGIQMHFAQIEQAETAETGLPADLAALEVNIYSLGSFDGPIDSTGCLAVGPRAAERDAVSLDLDPAEDLVVEVLGWPAAGCNGDPGWRGLAFRQDVVRKEETTVAVYVTRTGFRMNLIRDSLPGGRAFASATVLPDGKVLIAGGFDGLSGSGLPVTLSAACDALIYDPGLARIVRVLALPHGCRGLHQAIALEDGRVMLVGGASEAVFDPLGATRPMLRPVASTLLSSVEIFDPAPTHDEAYGAFLDDPTADDTLHRAMAPALELDDGTLLLLGGRSDALRSDEIVLGTGTPGDGFIWRRADESLVTGRSGALALLTGQGVLLAGGNAPGSPSLELLLPDNRFSYALDLGALDNDKLALTGHSLLALGGSSIVLAGGTASNPGALPTGAVYTGIWDGDTYALQTHHMVRERAYHTSLLMSGIAAGGTMRTVQIGGLNAGLFSNADLELVDPGSDGELIDDPLGVGALGAAAVVLFDGTALIAGGLDLSAAGQVSLSAEARILAP